MASATENGSSEKGSPLLSDGIPRSSRIEKALQELDEHGVTVIPDVITEDECDDQITLLHEWLAKFHPNHPSNINSIIHKYSIGHCETAWTCRLKVKPIFSEIFGTDKLLSSTDGLAIGPPPELGDAHFKFVQDGNSFDGLHLDQGPRRRGLHAYQGALYLEEAEWEDYCFKVIKDSHKYHGDFFTHFKPGARSEFRKLNKKEVGWYLEQPGCKVQRVAVPKGGLVLWDSRTVHAGAPPVVRRQNSRWRYVVFICMAPAKWASHEDYTEKRKGYEAMRTSRHWPAHGASFFPNYAAQRQDIEEMPEIAKTEEAMKLAGVTLYEMSPTDAPTWIPEFDAEYDHLPY